MQLVFSPKRKEGKKKEGAAAKLIFFSREKSALFTRESAFFSSQTRSKRTLVVVPRLERKGMEEKRASLAATSERRLGFSPLFACAFFFFSAAAARPSPSSSSSSLPSDCVEILNSPLLLSRAALFRKSTGNSHPPSAPRRRAHAFLYAGRGRRGDSRAAAPAERRR